MQDHDEIKRMQRAFKVGARVRYINPEDPADREIPETWTGRVREHEPNIEDGLYCDVTWTTPNGTTHDGLYHFSNLEVIK